MYVTYINQIDIFILSLFQMLMKWILSSTIDDNKQNFVLFCWIITKFSISFCIMHRISSSQFVDCLPKKLVFGVSRKFTSKAIIVLSFHIDSSANENRKIRDGIGWKKKHFNKYWLPNTRDKNYLRQIEKKFNFLF